MGIIFFPGNQYGKNKFKVIGYEKTQTLTGGGRVVRWGWVIFQCQGVLQIWIIVGQGPTALAVVAGGCNWYFFSRLSILFFLPLSGRRTDID